MTTPEANDLQTAPKQPVATEGTRPGPGFRPEIDHLEEPDDFVVFAELPGADESSVDVKLEKGTLVLDARLAAEPETEWTPLHTEYEAGSYHREFRISNKIDAAGVSAAMKNGVLELRLPKHAAEQPRQINVAAG